MFNEMKENIMLKNMCTCCGGEGITREQNEREREGANKE